MNKHPSHAAAPAAGHQQGFSYTRTQFLNIWLMPGAGPCQAHGRHRRGCGGFRGLRPERVSVRKGELETVERNRDKSLGVTVYVGHRRGNASTSDFSPAAVEQTVQRCL
jgi:PmbA protein